MSTSSRRRQPIRIDEIKVGESYKCRLWDKPARVVRIERREERYGYRRQVRKVRIPVVVIEGLGERTVDPRDFQSLWPEWEVQRNRQREQYDRCRSARDHLEGALIRSTRDATFRVSMSWNRETVDLSLSLDQAHAVADLLDGYRS